MARTDLRTKSTSTSVAYLNHSINVIRGFSFSDVSTLLFQFSQDLSNVGRIGQSDHDVEFLQFDIDGIIVLDEEDFHFIL